MTSAKPGFYISELPPAVVEGLDDPELNGWRLEDRASLVAPAGHRLRVARIEDFKTGDVIGGVVQKLVYLDVDHGDGVFRHEDARLVFVRDDIETFDDFRDAWRYATRVRAATTPDGRPILEDFNTRRFNVDGGPRLSPRDLHKVGQIEGDLARLPKILEQLEPDQRLAALRVVEAIVEDVFKFGRIVATAELHAQHEAPVRTGHSVKEGAGKGGKHRGRQVNDTAKEWRKPFCDWATQKAAELEAEEGHPVSWDDLLSHLESKWPGTGFPPQAVKPKRSTLKEALVWGQEQSPPAFRKASAPRGRKNRVVQPR